jgi:FkbM family methyltransferase
MHEKKQINNLKIDKNDEILKKNIEKEKLKKTFKEYGFEIKEFRIEDIGEVEYAQWLHPFEKPKTISDPNIKIYEKLSKKEGFIIDIGAHTGDTTAPMALAVGKDGLVLGLEPNKYVYKILEKNASLNLDKTNIIPLNFAATDNDGHFIFNYSDASFCNGGFLSQINSKRHKHNFTLEVEGKKFARLLVQRTQKRFRKIKFN